MVSTLIQPEDRMQAEAKLTPAVRAKLFQPSSSPKTGCKPRTEFISCDMWNKFQPSSSPKTGCKAKAEGSQTIREQQVSTLIQPEDRMQALSMSFILVDCEPP